ncbi:hypothetical protein [Taibaiella koreensis]|uniref:hypothetical protein n=1 Tax=Taibaiella koreensis TaxID=1268548 RepID=UPI0013C2AC72|nr:hypothetical protein [Taibaiella koreensis]
MKKKTSTRKSLSLTKLRIATLDKVAGGHNGAFNHSRFGPAGPSVCRYCQN